VHSRTKTKVIWQKAKSLWQVHLTLRLYSPGGSMGLTVWQQFAIGCFGCGFNPKSPLFLTRLSNTMCLSLDPHVYLPKGI